MGQNIRWRFIPWSDGWLQSAKMVNTSLLHVHDLFFRGTSWEFLVGVCRLVLRILTLFEPKKCHFPHPFSDLASKNSYPFSDLEVVTKRNKRVYIDRNYVIFAEIRTPTKRFLSFLFIYCSSLVNHTRFQTECIPVFRPKRRQNPTLWGGTYPYG